ncbi:MAG: hypothetical protein K0S47_3750 [Herbinix sp.]|nr:hypothetical protein [Herbinix sp.]
MYKIAVLGDRDSIYGFAALGLDTYPVESKDEAAKILKKIADGMGIRNVKKSVERAVGSDILFNNDK